MTRTLRTWLSTSSHAFEVSREVPRSGVEIFALERDSTMRGSSIALQSFCRPSNTIKVLLLFVTASCLYHIYFSHVAFKITKHQDLIENRKEGRWKRHVEALGKTSEKSHSRREGNTCTLPNLLVVVLASTRFFPLLRLLTSLRGAIYDCAEVNLHISVDAPRNSQMMPFSMAVFRLATSFEWPHGHKTLQRVLLHRGLALSWFETIFPGQEEYIMVVEDDMEVSRHFYKFFSSVVQTRILEDDRLASMCIHPTWGLDPSIDHQMSDTTYWVIVRYACSWGPIWTRLALLRFRQWLFENYGKIKPYVPHEKEMNKYVAQGRDVQSSWTCRFLAEMGMVTLLHRVSVRSESVAGTFLLLNHKEPGLHIKRKQVPFTSPSLLLTQYDKAGPALRALPHTNGSLSEIGAEFAGVRVVEIPTFDSRGGSAAALKAEIEAEEQYSRKQISKDTCWLNSSCHLDLNTVKKVLVDFSSRNVLVNKQCLGIPDFSAMDMMTQLHKYYYGIKTGDIRQGTLLAICLAPEGLSVLSYGHSHVSCESVKANVSQEPITEFLHCVCADNAQSWPSGLASAAIHTFLKISTTEMTRGIPFKALGDTQNMTVLSNLAKTSTIFMNIAVTEGVLEVLQKLLRVLKPPRLFCMRLNFFRTFRGEREVFPALVSDIYERGFVCTVLELYPRGAFGALNTFNHEPRGNCRLKAQLVNQALFSPTAKQADTERAVELLCFPPRESIPLFTYNL